MAETIADALVRIRPSVDDAQFKSSAAAAGSSAGDEAGKGFANKFGASLKGAIGAVTALAGLQVVKFFKDTIENASDLNESTSKLQVVFGKASQSVLAFGKDSATSMGISQRTYRDTVGTLGNLLVSLKLPQTEAANMSTKMVKLAGDMASFNNTSPVDALEAIRSGLVGETEPLRAYGVNLNDAQLRQEAVSLGLEKTTKNVLPPAIRAQAAYALILDQTKTAQGDFSRTSTGLANSQRILSAEWDDITTKIGQLFLPIVVKLVAVIKTNVMPALTDFVNGLQGGGGIGGQFAAAGAAIRTFLGDLQSFISVLNQNKTAVIAFAGTLVTAKIAIEALAVATRAWAAIQTAVAFVQLAIGIRSAADAMALLDVAMDANPIGLVVVAIAALVAGLVLAWQHSETFRNVIIGTWDAIKVAALFLWHNVFDPLWHGIEAAFNGIVAAAKLWWSAIQTEFDLARAGVGLVVGFFQALWTGIKAVFDGIVVAAQTWWAGVQAVFSAVSTAVQVLSEPFLWLWHSIFEPVFAILGTIVKDFYILFYDTILLAVKVVKEDFTLAIQAFEALWTAVWNGIKSIVTTWWAGVQVVWNAVISMLSGPFSAAQRAIQALWTSVWNTIVSIAQTTWTGIQVVWNAIVSYLGGPLSTAFHAIQSTFNTVWNAIADIASNVWTKIKSYWQDMVNFVTSTIPNAFRTAVDAIGNFWNSLQDKVKTPINFVIGFINRGIIGPINSLVGTFGGTKLSDIPGLRTGGVIPGSVRNDGILGLAAGGMPTARVESGEFVVNRKQTAKHLPVLQAINDGVQGFALGGLIGDVIGLVTDPIGHLSSGLGDLASSLGGTGFAQMLIGIPKKVIEWAGKWIKDKFTSLLGGTTASLGGPGGNSIAAILAWAKLFDPTASVSSGYRPGDPGYHGAGLAADIVGANMDAIAQGFYNMSSHLLELIHSPSWFVKNGVRVGSDFYASVFAEHFNHVHVAAYANALGFANGGTINEPIWGVGRSGRRYTFGERGPETVVPGGGGIGGGVNLTIHVHGDVGDAQVRAIRSHVDSAFRQLQTQIKTGRRR